MINNPSPLTFEKLKAAVELLKNQSVPTGDVIVFRRPSIGGSCSQCKHEQFGHQPYSDEHSDGHPFCKNNLEYLEWKANEQDKI